MWKMLLAAACLSLMSMTQVVHANDVSPKTGKELTDKQQKRKDCGAEAKQQGLKKERRKAYVKQCMGKFSAAENAEKAEKKAARKAKMKTCNAEAKAKGLKKDERKAFMKDCLKD